jgi:phosphoglycerate dehydrogenase-like enzyme
MKRLLLSLMLTALAGAVHGADTTLCALDAASAMIEEVVSTHREAELMTFSNPGEMLETVEKCDAIVGMPGGAVGRELIRAGENLTWIQTFSAGVEAFAPELVDHDIVLTNVKILQGPEIADHAMALLLNLTRDLKFYNEQTQWARNARLPMIELRAKTALIIGLGGIGTQIAQRAAAFDMRVIAIDPKDIPLHRDVAYVGKPDELNDLLPEADVVFSSVPHTPATDQMLGREQFGLMKDGVYLVNVSRGRIVDTNALVAALRSGKVVAAGLDVTDPEPLPSGHPLWSMPNVVVTPHIATRSDRLEERRAELFRENVARFIEGRPLKHVVDKARGY